MNLTSLFYFTGILTWIGIGVWELLFVAYLCRRAYFRWLGWRDERLAKSRPLETEARRG